MRPLLLLDITGVLCHKVDKGKGIIKVNSYDVNPRPGHVEFLQTAFKEFEVGFFSSTTKTNADPILKALLTKEQYKACILFWYRDRTRFDPEVGDNDFATIKVLDDLFANPIANREKKWNKTNTLIVDDSPSKVRFNDPMNVVMVESYEGGEDKKLIGLLDQIRDKFAELTRL